MVTDMDTASESETVVVTEGVPVTVLLCCCDRDTLNVNDVVALLSVVSVCDLESVGVKLSVSEMDRVTDDPVTDSVFVKW